MSDELTDLDRMRQFRESVVSTADLMAEILTPILRDIPPFIESLYDLFWQAYLNAGAPYGESVDGMMRWYREIGEARRLQNKADRILQHQKMLVEFRKAIAK